MADKLANRGDLHALSPDEFDPAIGFLDYGNLAGAFWFVGIEERGVGAPDTLWQELRVRAKHLASIEDLKAASERRAFGPSFQVGQHVPTWLIMSKIVLRLSGEEAWHEYAQAQQYQAERLGRRDGETFLVDLLPLPAGNVDHWPTPSCSRAKTPTANRCCPAESRRSSSSYISTHRRMSSATARAYGMTSG